MLYCIAYFTVKSANLHGTWFGRIQPWETIRDLRNVGIGTVRQRGSCLSKQSQLFIAEVAAMGHHCLWIIVSTNNISHVLRFYQHLCFFVQNVCPCVWLCPHLVREQVVFVIDVCVRLWFRKQLLYELHLLNVFTDVTLEISAHMSERIWGVTFDQRRSI